MPWVDPSTGETSDKCPLCEGTTEHAEMQMRGMEMELRRMRSKITRLENAAAREAVAKRDGAVWKELLACWLLAFPDKRPTATGIKSARAAAVFVRLESGASVEDCKNAIAGAMRLPFIVFGKRRESGAPTDRADDLAEIMSVNNDAQFDLLRDVGAKLRRGTDG